MTAQIMPNGEHVGNRLISRPMRHPFSKAYRCLSVCVWGGGACCLLLCQREWGLQGHLHGIGVYCTGVLYSEV